MSKANAVFSIMLLSIMIGIFGITIIGVMQHETAHQQIDLQNGCEDSKITYNWQGGETQGINCTVNENRSILNGLNEIVWYNNVSIILTIFICTLILCQVIIKTSYKEDD